MLSLKSVDASIERIPILRDINLDVAAAETIALVGRNGAGKTTLLRSIMGFTDCSGQITFEGRDLAAVEPHQRPAFGIGYAPEDRRLFSRFTHHRKHPAARPSGQLDEAGNQTAAGADLSCDAGAGNAGTAPCGSVSGGQGKMVALSRALMLSRPAFCCWTSRFRASPRSGSVTEEALGKLREIDPTLAIIITESNPGLLRRFASRTVTVERGMIDSDVLA